jgi:hypothetical protein
MPQGSPDLLRDLRLLIEQARAHVAQAINSELVMLHWRVGRRINQDVLKGRRAEYGKQIFPTLSGKSACRIQQGLFAAESISDESTG